MEITNIKTHVLKTPLKEKFIFSNGWVTDRHSLLIELETDCGIIGWGESLCHGQQSPLMARDIIENVLKEHVIGKSAFDIEVIWEFLYNRTRPYGQSGIIINAMSGIDVAIWDALGQYYKQPISNLIGGRFRNKIEAYATGFQRKPDRTYPQDAVEEAQRHVANGFRGMKLKAGFGVEEDIAYIRAVRESVDAGCKVMVDFNSAYNVAQARKLLYNLKDLDIFFYEELLAPEDIEGYISLRHLTPSYMAAGEQTFTKFGYRDFIARGALDILQPDICSCGGITECKKIAAMAQAWHTMVIPHIWGSSIGMAASLQYLASLPNSPLCFKPLEPMMEFDAAEHPFNGALIHNAITIRDGWVDIPAQPGLGITVNRDVIQEFRWNK
jgi:D-galactarolactone cycloisomerase